MRYYNVIFKGTPYKTYTYQSKKELPVGAICKIVADETTKYENSVKIVEEIRLSQVKEKGLMGKLRTITSYSVINGGPRPKNHIKSVYFNEEKGTTCVIWEDETKTLVKCSSDDVFDKEKGLALCYMKRLLGNRGSFNETLKEYCHD